MPRDYYEVLGVSRSATEKEIRNAFRKLARQHHPDVNPGDPGAAARFKEINEANEVLSDKERRPLYDRFGRDWSRVQQGSGQPGPAQGPSQWRTGRVDLGDMGGGLGGVWDIFDRFFGGGGGAAARTRTRQRGPAAVEQPIEITLEEALSGTTRSIQVSAQGVCARCGGGGWIGSSVCTECHGQGTTARPVRGEVTIPPGVDSGSRVRVTPGGHEVVMVVRVRPHPRFRRRGPDLDTEVSVPVLNAMLGGEARVPTVQGQVALTLPPETQNGRVFRLKGQGMPRLEKPAERGDLHVTVKVELPSALSDKERELLRQWKALRG